MKSNILEESQSFHRNAVALLKKHRIIEHLQKHGEVLLTGAFAANLMLSGDIDIYVLGNWDKPSVRIVFEQLLDTVDIKSWQLFNWIKYRDPRFPKAWYIGLKDVFRGRKWKIDIWFLNKKQIESLPFAVWDSKSISDSDRLAILRFKKYRDQKKLEISSYRIYQAVLERGKKSIGEIQKYCGRFGDLV
ncbi:MAG TPA: hypothetical protein VFQ60_01680 [Patescibacteria group bacterium]|nr:hypothetical protein [Patescibacteria group bacterium]